MKKTTVKSFEEFINIINKYDQSVIFRGVSDESYKLEPSLFWWNRPIDPQRLEERVMQLFKTRGRAFITERPKTEMEWLILARHYDLPSRLLDWSSSPLVACFFAVNKKEKDKDAAVYLYNTDNYISEFGIDILKLDSIKAFLPSYISNQLVAQSSVFTIHPNKQPVLDTDEIMKIVIKAHQKDRFKEILCNYGIHKASLFPGLDSLAEHIKFQIDEWR